MVLIINYVMPLILILACIVILPPGTFDHIGSVPATHHNWKRPGLTPYAEAWWLSVGFRALPCYEQAIKIPAYRDLLC